MMSYQKANEDLKVQLRDFDRRLKEVESRCRASDSKVAYYESMEYTTKVVDAYSFPQNLKTSSTIDVVVSYERGCAHILCQFYHLIPDKALMCRAFEGSYANPEFRSCCDFVLFTESELPEIAAADQKVERQWTPPAPVHPDLVELCDQYRE